MNDHGADTFAPVESVTVMVEANLPAVVPEPVSAPVVVLSVIPGGSEPAKENVYGARPPAALTPVTSGALTAFFEVHPVVGAFAPTRDCSSSGATTKIESCFVSVVPLPFAWTVKPNVPLCVGVPETTPVGASVSPGGSVPPASVHELTVSPDAVSAGAVYDWLIAASGRPSSRRPGAAWRR